MTIKINTMLSNDYYKKEYQALIDMFGLSWVSYVFTSFDSYVESRTKGNYSFDAIKQNLKTLTK